MLLEANNPRDVRFRKDRSILNIAGTGVMLFGLWSIIKTYTYFFEDPEEMFEGIAELAEAGTQEIIMLSVMISLILSFDLLIRFYVGMKSRAESKGKKAGSLYLLVTGFLTIASIGFLFLEIISILDDPNINSFAEIIVELTSLVIQTELIISAIRIKTYKPGKVK